MSLLLTASDNELRAQFLALRTRADIARLLDIEEDLLIYHLYIVHPSNRYKKFKIPKKSGGHRDITAPATALKIIQAKLNQVLLAVYQTKPAVHGYVRTKSIVTNAKVHSRQRFVLNLDLQDFFPSIHFGRVRGLFCAVPYGLPTQVAQILAHICCFDGGLPQGAPTSPIVSNMICSRLDSQLLRLAQRHRCIYTRYADDLTFSTSMPRFPAALATISSETGNPDIGFDLAEIVARNGFRINPSKTRLQPRHRRQEVTGLTANKRPNVQRKFIQQIRAMLHDWSVSHLEGAEEHHIDIHGSKYRDPDRPKISFARVVKGKIDFLGMVRGKTDPLYLRFLDEFRELAPELAPKRDDPLTVISQQFSDMEDADDPRRRGYILQDLIKRLFDLSDIPFDKPFTRNEGAEQIDGAFRLDGWHYIVECRWREKLADTRELDGLSGQVNRSGKQTMGFFLSINGWSDLVPPLLKQNRDKSIVLMNGDDLRVVLTGTVNLRRLIEAKVAKLNLDSEPYLAAADYLRNP